MKKEFYVKPFNDHSQCTGHRNWMLDNTMEKVEDREIMINILDRHIKDYEKKLAQEGNETIKENPVEKEGETESA